MSESLRERQKRHLEGIQRNVENNEDECLHNKCTECIGTGVKKDGTPCIHYISCPCPKCSPRM